MWWLAMLENTANNTITKNIQKKFPYVFNSCLLSMQNLQMNYKIETDHNTLIKGPVAYCCSKFTNRKQRVDYLYAKKANLNGFEQESDFSICVSQVIKICCHITHKYRKIIFAIMKIQFWMMYIMNDKKNLFSNTMTTEPLEWF